MTCPSKNSAAAVGDCSWSSDALQLHCLSEAPADGCPSNHDTPRRDSRSVVMIRWLHFERAGLWLVQALEQLRPSP